MKLLRLLLTFGDLMVSGLFSSPIGSSILRVVIQNSLRICLSLLLYQQPCMALDPESVLDRWLTAISSQRSFDAIVHTKASILKKPSGDYFETSVCKLRTRFRDGMWRIDVIELENFYLNGKTTKVDLSAKDVQAFAYDGSLIRFLNTKENFGEVSPPNNFNFGRLPALMPQEQWLHLVEDSELLVTLLKPRLPQASVEKAELNRFTLIFPSSPQLKIPNCLEEIRIEFDGQCPFPSRLIFAKGGVSREYSAIWSISSSGYFPTTYAKKFFKSGNDPVFIEQSLVDSVDLKSEIPWKVFQLAFPVGTVVSDDRDERNFIVRDGDEKDYEAFAKYMKGVVEADRLRKKNQFLERGESSILLFSIFGVLLLLLSLLIWFLSR